ncbi:MAG: biopolymer transporter ExbD [Candidatus Melainabacteria bacterium]|nr:biopolymer transporter ExbD [Candidatus Melainabacteria bacterium]MBI3308772.1 biopolymer transporter ExbD [Candidatus Melainabacteria bacterium]
MAFGGSSGSGGRQTFSEINITPLTDVFLVLLIIMILIAPLINQSALKVEPPVAEHGKAESDNKAITVDVSKEGVIAVNNKKVSDESTPVNQIQGLVRDALNGEFEKLGDKEVPVAVRADADSRQKYVISVLDAAAGIGVKKLRIVTLQHDKF